MLNTNKDTATGHCALITPYWSFISNKAVGTILTFAAIGVNNVPQYPASIAIGPIIAGFALCILINIGIPIPVVIIAKAANAFPITIVNSAIPRQYVATTAKTLSTGITLDIPVAITLPTPAIPKT